MLNFEFKIQHSKFIIIAMASNPIPPANDDDDWAPPKRSAGQWESDAAPATGGKRPAGGLADVWNDPRSRPLVLVSGFALLGICALSCFILALILATGGGTSAFIPAIGPGNGIGVEDVDATQQPITDTVVIRVNGAVITPSIPARMSVGSTTFEVQPMRIAGKEWNYDPNAARTAYWVPGTMVNYVLGVQASSENRQIIDALNEGDLITLDTNMGAQRYRVTQQATVGNNANDLVTLLAQDSPRLTIVMMGEGGNQRRVTLAQFTDEGTANQLAAVGVPVNLGDIRVLATNQRLLPGGSVGLPSGKNYLQVDFAVTNLITDYIDAAQFFTQLTDGAGNTYPLSLEGSKANGAAGFAQGALGAGKTMTGTAAFEVPSTMAGPTLEWKFALNESTPYVARVAIPYRPILAEPTVEPTGQPKTRVTIVSANITSEGNELRIVGSVQNLTNEFLQVSLPDVSLSSPNGQQYPLTASLPAFPWSVQPNESLTFQLSFTRPPNGPVTFTMFDQAFSLSGF
jgi:hypothetical protein